MRTVRDFVKQLVTEGKIPRHIRAVSSCTKWVDEMDNVDYLAEKLYQKREKWKREKKHQTPDRVTDSKRLKIRRRKRPNIFQES